MDPGIVITSALMGIYASTSCVGTCLPIMVPFIMEKRTGPARGFKTALLFSLGRLVMYLSLAFVLWTVYGHLKNEMRVDDIEMQSGFSLVLGIIGGVILAYAILSLKGFEGPHWCPLRARGSLMAVVMGIVVGSIVCPWLLIIITDGIGQGSLPVLILVVVVFWSFSSLGILTAGGISGYIGKRWQKKSGFDSVRTVSLLVLVLVGVYYLFIAAVNFSP